MNTRLLSLEIKAQTIALRMRLLRERKRAHSEGWTTPSVKEVLREPTNFEIPLMSCRFLNRSAPTALVDVGANTGYWAERFLRFVPARYIGVEPDPRAFKDLKSRFPAEQLHNVAAGADPGRVRLNLTTDSVYSTVGAYRSDAHIKTDVLDSVDVDVIRLDTLDVPFEQIIIKIDVQGFEPHVLRGAPELLSRATAVIVETPLWPTTEHENDLGLLAGLLRQRGLSPMYFGLAGLSDRATIPVESDVIFARPEKRRMV
jgi:FkbM family methyltransferase